jgi:hypothetical protein
MKDQKRYRLSWRCTKANKGVKPAKSKRRTKRFK